MNILMINPRGMYFDEGVSAYKRISFPMGLMSLSSSIKKIEFDEENNWHARETDRPNTNITLIDAAAEKFGAEDGEGDPLITRNGKKIRIFGLSDEEILSRAQGANPDVIFVTAMFTKQLDEFYAVTRLMKENFPNAVIAGGGIALTQLGQLPLDPSIDDGGIRAEIHNKSKLEPFENGVDIIVAGEGEISAVKLIDRIETMSSQKDDFNPKDITPSEIEDIPNLVFRPKEESKTIETRGTMISSAEFNRLPFPDLSVINKDIYHSKRAHFGEAKSDNWIELFTSRGCSKSCTFCSTQPFFKAYRKLSDVRVKELLQYYHENGFDEVCVEDDSILDYPARAARIFQMVKETGFKQFTAIGGIEFRHLLFDSQGQKFYMHKVRGPEDKWFLTEEEYLKETKNMSEEDADALYAELIDGQELIESMSSDLDPNTGESKENGCYRIYLAMESANEATLRSIGKLRNFPVGPNGESHRRPEAEAMKMLDDAGIEAHGGIMMGNPQTEGITEIMNNIRFSREMMENGLGRVAFFPYIMLPGSHMSRVTNSPVTYEGEDGQTLEPYARIRTEHGYLSYGFDTSNMDSLKHSWTAEELITINVWANNLFAAGKGRNWSKGQTVSQDDLEDQITIMSDPEILYQTTALRVMKEGGAELLNIYHEAIKAVSPEHKLPDYVYHVSEDQEISDKDRSLLLDESRQNLDVVLKELNDPRLGVENDYRSEYATDFLELAMRAPEIKVLPTDETLDNQERSDFITPSGNQEVKRELHQEISLNSNEEVPSEFNQERKLG